MTFLQLSIKSELRCSGCRTGRDNKLHIWNRITELPPDLRVGGSATLSTVSTPALLYSMDINALNYCRFSLVLCSPQTPPPSSSSSKFEEMESALIALPNLIDSSTVNDLARITRPHPYLRRLMFGLFPRKTGYMQRSDRKETNRSLPHKQPPAETLQALSWHCIST